jgi:hypothetical protein
MNTQECQTDPVTDSVVRSVVSKHKKIHLIRKFQRFEGNLDCCASAYTRVCKQFECLWRDECLALEREEVR